MTDIEQYLSGLGISYAASVGYLKEENGGIVCDEKLTAFSSDCNGDTLFDAASVTKVLAVAIPFLRDLTENKLSLSQTLADYFDTPDDKKHITLENLITHTSGIRAGLRIQDYASPENAAQGILNAPLAYKTGTQSQYACCGFVLLGKILEKVEKMPLDVILREKVVKPFGLTRTCFCPKGDNIVFSNRREEERGLVNDFNARYIGGISGNAGVFTTLSDMKKIVGFLYRPEPYISQEVMANATVCHTSRPYEPHGLCFLVKDAAYPQCGDLFTVGSFGHCGHTGTCFFIDKSTGIYSVLLTNATAHFPDYNAVMKMRATFHNLAKQDLNV